MRALLCKALGGNPTDMAVEETDRPVPRAGEIVIRVKAVGLNFFDTLIIAGKYQYRPALPFSPGAEVSGIVTRIGGGSIAGFAEGDRVMAFTGWGGAGECRLRDGSSTAGDLRDKPPRAEGPRLDQRR
jgi:NADPH:quinone reductase